MVSRIEELDTWRGAREMSRIPKSMPTESDLMMVDHLSEVIDGIMDGRITGVAYAIHDEQFGDAWFYYNKASAPVLGVPLQKLHSLYVGGMAMSTGNAPDNNRSRRVH